MVRTIDFEVVPPLEREPVPETLHGYALYYVCEGDSGACVYRRQDFEVVVPVGAR